MLTGTHRHALVGGGADGVADPGVGVEAVLQVQRGRGDAGDQRLEDGVAAGDVLRAGAGAAALHARADRAGAGAGVAAGAARRPRPLRMPASDFASRSAFSAAFCALELAVVRRVRRPVLGLGRGAAALERLAPLPARADARALLAAADRASSSGVARHQVSPSVLVGRSTFRPGTSVPPPAVSSMTTPTAASRSRTASAVAKSRAARAAARASSSARTSASSASAPPRRRRRRRPRAPRRAPGPWPARCGRCRPPASRSPAASGDVALADDAVQRGQRRRHGEVVVHGRREVRADQALRGRRGRRPRRRRPPRAARRRNPSIRSQAAVRLGERGRRELEVAPVVRGDQVVAQHLGAVRSGAGAARRGCCRGSCSSSPRPW